ncbi:MAG: tRNA (adenosine(37)-N6)-threonylcarbamoyltransferase complex dimerization subunit type 1 TsaB [Terriglobales bacterium]
MLILSIDTAGTSGSVALCECGAGALARDFRLIELVPLAGRMYSAQLMPQLSALLERHHLNKAAVDAYAVASGPGSFTGLRVGLSTVKALAEIMDKPIAAVSLLQALAWRAMATVAEEGQVIAALDAARGQVFVGEYVVRMDTLPKLLREALLTLDDLAAEAAARPDVPVLTPDELVTSALSARGISVQLGPRPASDVIARLGALQIAAGQITSPEALDANYIRRSDAEIFSKQ